MFSVRSENQDDSSTVCGPLASIPDKLLILMLCEGIPMYKWLIRVDFRQNLLRSMHSMSFQFCLGQTHQQWWPSWHLIDWDIYLFLPTAGFFGLIRWLRWLSCPLLDRSSFYFSPTTERISKTFKLSCKFWIRSWPLIFHICLSCNKAFLFKPFFWPGDLDNDIWHTFFKNFNLCHNFWPIRDKDSQSPRVHSLW